MDGAGLACGVSPTSLETYSSIVRGCSTRRSRQRESETPDGFYPKVRFGRGFIVARERQAPTSDTHVTRVRYDPGFINDPRWERLGADAYILHSFACAYVVHTLSDGFVSAGRALTLTPLVRKPKQAIETLLSDELWRAVSGGYLVCECHDNLRLSVGRGDEQPSRAYVDGEREKGRQRQEKWREKRRSNGVTNGVANPDGNGVSNGDQCSAVQHSAVQEPPVPVPALLADDDTVCEHGTPSGKLLTVAGDPRCPLCRRLTVVPDSA